MNDYPGAELPNHTQTPNSFFDKLLAEIDSLCELKVTLTIVRQTFGWHKSENELSLTQLQKHTGLSRQGVIDGLELGMKRGTIMRRPKGQGFIYRLKLVNDLDQQTSQQNRPVKPRTSQPFRPELVNHLDPQKKGKEITTTSVVATRTKITTSVSLCREITGRSPNPKQRSEITAQVKDLGRWREVLETYMLEGQPPNKVNWMLERYHGKESRGSPAKEKWQARAPTLEDLAVADGITLEEAKERYAGNGITSHA